MHRILAAAALAALFVVAACGSTTDPSPSPSDGPSQSPVPSVSAPPSPSVEPSAEPSVEPTAEPTEAPTEQPIVVTSDEQYLIDGVLRDAEDCRPVRADLPAGAIAGIECTSDDPAVAEIGFYLFEDEAATVAAYLARMAAEGIALETGGACVDGEGEGSYVPYEGQSPWRSGCFLNDEGYANYRATLPGSHVYFGILGRSDDMAALADFAWRGNQDVPGGPTLWGEPAD